MASSNACVCGIPFVGARWRCVGTGRLADRWAHFAVILVAVSVSGAQVSCGEGNASGCFSLGEWHAVVGGDLPRAAELYATNCDTRGHADSCYNLAFMLRECAWWRWAVGGRGWSWRRLWWWLWW